MEEFSTVFSDLEDPRTGNAKRHDLLEMLLIALCTILCGGETCSDMALFGRSKHDFLKEFMTLENGIPSHDTFSRLFRLLSPEQFHGCFVTFMRRFAENCKGVVAVDGKTLRRSFDKAKSSSALHMVHAFACEARLMLGQLAVDGKSNEITAVPKLLAMLSLKGCIVTTDAMHCQRKTCAQICEQGGDYVLALKDNQPGLLNDVRLFLDDRQTPLESARETDAGHGRIEQRKAFVSTDIAWLQEHHDWPGLAAIGKVEASRESGGKTSHETRYYLLSRPLDAARFGAVVRGHWRMENSLHWVLDVTMNEDQARNRKDNGPENLALLRRLALNLAKLEPSKGSMRGKLKRAGWDNRFLNQLLEQFANSQMR